MIQIENLTRHYHLGGTTVRALDGVTLDIKQGEFVTVVGSSGSGKSTLMHVLGCLDNPTDGRFLIDNVEASDLDDVSLSDLRNHRIGFVFQQFNLLSELTVVENIAVPLVYAGIDRKTQIETASEYATMLGLGDRLGHKPTELSGGQCQRVAIARALVNEPDIIFADEPTGNLDSATGREIMQVLNSLNDQGYTIIMVTHDPILAEAGSRKITMRDGKVVADEPGSRRLPEDAERRRTAARKQRSRSSNRKIGLGNLIRIGIREGLQAHAMRTLLTMLGIVIAVAGVISMSSFSLGSKRKQADQIKALGVNLVRVVDGQLEGQKLADARIAGSQGLSLRDLEMLHATVPDISRAAAVRYIKLNIADTLTGVSANTLAVSQDYLAVNNLRMAEGRFLSDDDAARSARVAVIGNAIARRLLREVPGEPVLGRRLVMGATPYTIVGILADRDVDLKGLEATGARDSNYDVLMPLGTILTRTRALDMRSQIDELNLQIGSDERLVDAGTAIRRVLHAAHNGVDDFQLVVPLELLKQKEQSQRLLDVLTLCIASIALVVGGIGIMNIMLASVTERTREIGVRRAVGATERDILHQFLSESVVISATGGLLGLLLSVLVVIVAGTALDLPVVFSGGMITLAIGAAVATGLGFGLYPAMQAARKNPVEALRYE